MEVARTIFRWYFYFYTVYSVSIFVYYGFIIFSSIRTIRNHLLKNSHVQYREVVASKFSPRITILIPMYNEGRNSLVAVRSLLSSEYSNFDIVVINDGSKDDTLQLLIDEFSLRTCNASYIEKIPTQPVRGIYTSSLEGYHRLILIDKQNGGKADSLNVGLNYTQADFILCVDGDCVLTRDALQKLVKPVMDSDKRVIASGGVIRVANGCVFKDGELAETNLSERFIVRFQILEYLRSFLLARTGWSNYNGLMLISGALGLLDHKLALEVGGYDVDNLGEDMDIIVRMQRKMYEEKIPFRVSYIPDPLSWTETPESSKILYRQRVRWTRGNITTLWRHKGMFFNRKYGVSGMFAFPFWLIFECYGPLIELSGVVFFLCAYWLDAVNMLYTISFLIATYLYSIMYSLIALYVEDSTFQLYRKKGDYFKLVATVLLEPIAYHVFLLIPSLVGHVKNTLGFKKTWGNMERKGLSNVQDEVKSIHIEIP